jgi:uncharacterized RDD family membrane protein YckC
MTTAPHTFGHTFVSPTEAVHVTGRRVIATIIDGLVFGFAYWLIALLFGEIRTVGDASNWLADVPVLANVTYGLFVVAYYILLEGYLGQTLGKMVTGIRVVAEATGEVPGLASSAIRTVLRIIDGLFSYLVAVIAAPDRVRQAATAG